MLYVTYKAFVFIAPPPFETISFHFFHPLFYFLLYVFVYVAFILKINKCYSHTMSANDKQHNHFQRMNGDGQIVPYHGSWLERDILQCEFASFEPYDLFIYLFCRRRISLSIMLAAVSIIFSAFHLLISLFFCVSGCRMTLFYAV